MPGATRRMDTLDLVTVNVDPVRVATGASFHLGGTARFARRLAERMATVTPVSDYPSRHVRQLGQQRYRVRQFVRLAWHQG